MKLFKVSFNGHYLGGIAMVKASCDLDAIDVTKIAMVNAGLHDFSNMEAIEVKFTAGQAIILNNGDY